MNKLNKLLVITLVMGLMIASAIHNDVLAQANSEKEKVLERSKRFPRWAKGGWSRGKVFKQKKNGSKNTQLCSKGGTAYWFVTDYEFKINRKYKSTGKPFNAPRQHAERLAYADQAARLAELIGTSIETEIGDKTKYTDDAVEALTDVANAIKTEKNVQGLLRVGSAWKRVERYDRDADEVNKYWKIHSWCSICQEDYHKIIKDNAKAAGVSDELVQTMTEGITLDIEERDVETDEYDDSDSGN